MKRIRSRIVPVVLAVCLAVMAAMPGFAEADVSAFNVAGLTIAAASPNLPYGVGEWTVNENSASVTGSSFWGVSMNSGTLTLTAENAGVISFNYSAASTTTVTINGTANSGSGSASVEVGPGGSVEISATFTSSTSDTLTISNIAIAASGKQYVTVYSSDYTTLAAAVAAATGSNVVGTVIVDTNTTLSSDLVIPDGVTLVVPNSADDTGKTTASVSSGAVVNGTAYSTLTIAGGKTLTVNGSMIVSGNQQSTTKQAGCLTGNYGKVDVAGALVVNGALYAHGQISGTGTVTVNSGAAVHQLFQLQDWRGGNATVSANSSGVFPFNLYEVKNITAQTTYYNGATLSAQYYIYAASSDNVGDVMILGEGGLLKFASENSGDHVVETFDSNGVATVTVNGAIQSGSIAITAMGNTIDSADTISPFGYHMNIVVANGGSLEITKDLKILPGCNITVKNGGTLSMTSGVAMYLYGAGGYNSSYNYAGWPTGESSSAAVLTVETGGNVSGTFASTDTTFSNVDGYVSSGSTATVKEVTQSGSSVTVVNVSFYTGTPATAAE